jgi:hypothetical protein
MFAIIPFFIINNKEKKRKSYKQVYTFCVNKYKQNGKRITEYLNVIQCLLVNDAPFYILVFDRWRTINQQLVIHNSICVDLIVYTELQGKK